MIRTLPIAPFLVAAALLAGGCTFHRTPIDTWCFYDRQTAQPIGEVVLLEWTERTRSRSPEAQAFETQVPVRENLVAVRAGRISRDRPTFRPVIRGNVQAWAMTWSQRSRYMAICPGYGFRVTFASQEELARMSIDSAGDTSVGHVVLSRQLDPAVAVDWLAWLAAGRAVMRDGLSYAQRRSVYAAFADYWDRLRDSRAADLQSELSTRPPGLNLSGELSRIYREELDRKEP